MSVGSESAHSANRIFVQGNERKRVSSVTTKNIPTTKVLFVIAAFTK